MKENFKGPHKMDAPRQQLTTYHCYNREELLLIRESKYCRTRPDFLSKDFDNDDGLFSPDKWLQHKWKCEGVENRVRRKAASQTSAGSGGGGGSVSGNSTTTTTANTPQDSEKQNANTKAARLRRGTSTASNGMDFKPDFQKSALEATSRPNRCNSSQNALNNGGNGTSWSSTATTSKQGSYEKPRIRRGGGDRARKSTERRRSSNAGDEPLPEWMDQGPESAFDIIELMGFEEDIQSEKETSKPEEEHHSSPETILPSFGSMNMATSRLKQWMGEGTISEPKGLADDAQKTFSEAPSRCASSNNASSSGGGSSAIGPPKQIQQHIPFYEPAFDGIGVSSMPGPAGFYSHAQHTMGPPYLPPSRSPQSQFTPLPPPLVNNNNNSNIAASRSFLSSPIFLPNSGNHPPQGIHPLQMRHPFFGSNGPGGMVPPMPGHGLHHNQHHAQQQQPLFPPYLSPSRSPHNQPQFPPPPPLVNAANQISASRSFINSPAFMPNLGNHPHPGVHPLQMRHPFFGSNVPGGMGVPPMPGHGLHHHQQQPVMPAHLPPSRPPQTQFPPPPPLVNTNNQISASRSNHFNQNYNLLNSPAFMPTSVMRQMSKVPGGGAISTGSSETGSSTPNPTFSSGRSNIPPALEKIFASVRNQQTPDRSMLVRAILGQDHDDPSFSCSR